MKLPKIPIDYSKAGSGEAPFDFEKYILHGEGAFSEFIVFGVWHKGRWHTSGVLHESYKPTHYTPMPEFEEVQE